MIASLTGRLRTRNPTGVVLDVSGIGFELVVPLSTSKALGEVGQEAVLFVQAVFTREGMFLYGFATRDEKDTFNRLTAVRGIGPKAALNLLSRFTPGEIAAILSERKIETLKTVPGIGPKKADMILGRLSEPAPAPAAPQPQDEPALTALTALGLTRAEALKRLEQIPNRAGLGLNELLTMALKHHD